MDNAEHRGRTRREDNLFLIKCTLAALAVFVAYTVVLSHLGWGTLEDYRLSGIVTALGLFFCFLVYLDTRGIENDQDQEPGLDGVTEEDAMDGLLDAVNYCSKRDWNDTAKEIADLYQRVGSLSVEDERQPKTTGGNADDG